MRLQRPEADALNRLLRACNEAVRGIEGPELYPDERDRENVTGTAGRGNRGAGARKRSRKPTSAAGGATANVEYSDRSECFHISIAWVLRDPGVERGDGVSGSVTIEHEDLMAMAIRFDVVKVKMGNVVHDIPLGR